MWKAKIKEERRKKMSERKYVTVRIRMRVRAKERLSERERRERECNRLLKWREPQYMGLEGAVIAWYVRLDSLLLKEYNTQ